MDFLTKYGALKYLNITPKKILGNWLQLTLTINDGAAFSLGRGAGKFFSIFAVTVLFVIFYVGRRTDSNTWALTLGVLAGGITGNLSDRLFRTPGHLQGGVVDWIQVKHWPVFNFADMCIDVSVFMMIWLVYKRKPLDSKRLKNG